MKILHVYKYRGVNVYIRHLFREQFEYLIPMRGEIFSNLIEFNKERRRKNQKYTPEEEAHVIDTLKHIAQAFIDEERIKRSPSYKLNQFLNGKESSSPKAEASGNR